MFDSATLDIERGVDKIKWFAKKLSERAVIECSAIRPLDRMEELRKQRSEILWKTGLVVCEMWGKRGSVDDKGEEIHAMREIEVLDGEIPETSEEISEIGGGPR